MKTADTEFLYNHVTTDVLRVIIENLSIQINDSTKWLKEHPEETDIADEWSLVMQVTERDKALEIYNSCTHFKIELENLNTLDYSHKYLI